MEKKVTVTVEHAEDNLSAYIEGTPIMATGSNLVEVKVNIQEAVDLYLESCQEQNIIPPESLTGELSFTYRIDAATFFSSYSNIFTKAALSRITGINERQLWHYSAGIHKPRQQQKYRLQKGIDALINELFSIRII